MTERVRYELFQLHLSLSQAAGESIRFEILDFPSAPFFGYNGCPQTTHSTLSFTRAISQSPTSLAPFSLDQPFQLQYVLFILKSALPLSRVRQIHLSLKAVTLLSPISLTYTSNSLSVFHSNELFTLSLESVNSSKVLISKRRRVK